MRLNTATSHISVSVHRHGTKHMDSNPCVDSVFHPRRFTEHGTPTTTVGGRGFANRRQVSWTRAEFRELDSQTWNRNIWRSLQFLGFLVERPPTHSLQFAEPLSTRTRRIPGSVRKLGTNTVPATHCKDSLSRPRRFANLGTPTQVDWRRDQSSRFRCLTITPIRQYDFVLGDTRMHASARASARLSSSPVLNVHRHTKLLRRSR